jgi:hypothetical protein
MDLPINEKKNLVSSKSFIASSKYQNNIIFNSNYTIKQNKNDISILIEKINYFLDIQEELKKSINKIPSVESYIINDIENYKYEIIEYFSKIVSQIEKLKDDLSKGNEDIKTKFDLFLKEQAKFIKNNSSIADKELEIYKNLLEYYIHREKTNENYHSFKDIISKFYAINQEIIKILKDNNIKEKNKIDINELTEIEILKTKINILESHLKPKTSPIQNYKSKIPKVSSTKSFNRSVSTGRNRENKNKTLNELQLQIYSKDKEISYLNQHIYTIQSKADEEIKMIKDKIYKLQTALQKLTSEITNYSLINTTLEKENEKLMNEIKYLKNKKRFLSSSNERLDTHQRNNSMKNIHSSTEAYFQQKYCFKTPKIIKVNKSKYDSESNNIISDKKSDSNFNKSLNLSELKNFDSESEINILQKINSSPITEIYDKKSNNYTLFSNSKNKNSIKNGIKKNQTKKNKKS